MKKAHWKMGMFLATLVAVAGCGSKQDSPNGGLGDAQLVTQVGVGTNLADAYLNRSGQFSDEYCIQRVRFVSNGQTTDERLLIAAKACVDGVTLGIADAVIHKRVKQVNDSQFVLVSDKDATKLVGQVDKNGIGKFYLNILCDAPNKGTAYDNCAVTFDGSGKFTGLNEK